MTAAGLNTYFDGIIGCDVTVEEPVEHHGKGGQFEVCIRLTVPGKELVANRQMEEGLFAAIREAFDAIRRQLEDHVRELRGDVKAHDEAPHACEQTFSGPGLWFFGDARRPRNLSSPQQHSA
jgi:ribosome-associated translation inhibitor RaiA